MDFTIRPSMVKALARRSEGELLANRCTTTWEVLQVWRFDLISWADAPRPINFRTVQVAPV